MMNAHELDAALKVAYPNQPKRTLGQAFQWRGEEILRLSARLETEVRAHHRRDSAEGDCRCGKRWESVLVEPWDQEALEAWHAAHVNEAVAEALGTGP